MRYAEFIRLSSEEQQAVFHDLSEDEMNDLWDQKPFPSAGITIEDGRQYFDTTDELREYLLEHYVSSAKPEQADVVIAHERAHTDCALALGAVTVKYSVLNPMNRLNIRAVTAHHYGPDEMPNLAWAAISMHPYTSGQSPIDMQNIQSYGYASREEVAGRIRRWNEQDNGLYIPEPQAQPPLFL